MRSPLKFVGAVLCCLLLSVVTGCSSGGPSVTIAQSGSTTTIRAGSAAVTLTGTVNQGTNTNVTWNFSGTGCGTFASNGNSATYTPPAENALNANCTATITVTSAANSSVTNKIVFTVEAVALTLPNGESLTQTVTAGGAGITLTVDISNDNSGTATVGWVLTGAAAAATHVMNPTAAKLAQQLRQATWLYGAVQPAVGAATCGGLSATSGTSITFTPPAVGPCTATVTATVSTNPNVTQTFTITVNAAVVPTYTIGGNVTGLNSGTSVVLLDNGANALTVSSNTTFTFTTPLASGTTYRVTVGTEPTGESCQIANGGPLTVTANVTNVAVTCSPVSTASVVAEHELAQTGLAIALASNVLQSQLVVLSNAGTQSLACTPSSDGDYSYTTGATPTTNTASTPPTPIYPLTVYYGGSCANKYIVADVTSTDVSTSTLQETATYYGPDGTTKLGTLTLSETLTVTGPSNNQSYSANGLGSFCPGTSTCPNSVDYPAVQLGLYCTVSSTATAAQCGGGVAQNFPALNGGLAIGAVTPLTLTLASGSSGAVSFTGGGTAYTGPINSLTLTNPSLNSLVIAEGTGATEYTTTTASGSAGSFTLFPPTPTSWTLTDAAHDEQFVITVNSDRSSTIKITQISTGTKLAGGDVDQSGTSTGTGNMTYSDDSTAAITGWTLAD